MTVLEALKLEYEDNQKECDKIYHEYLDMSLKDIPVEEAWKWYNNHPTIKRSDELFRRIRQLETEYTTEPIEESDHIYTLKQFIRDCKEEWLIDYDGFGVYANRKKKIKTDISVYPSDITSGVYRTDFTHVIWYNR